MLQVENVREKLGSFNDRRRATERHKLAAVRNDLENERMSLDERARQMAPGLRAYYFNRISDLDEEIKTLKTKYPSFQGLYDSNKIESLKNVPHI